MKLTRRQIADLIQLTVSASADTMGCDGCHELLDQFAQSELDGNRLSESYELVRAHLEQCKCCRDEYDALLTALRAIA